jgi:MoaD family protein
MTIRFFADIRDLTGQLSTRWDRPADTVGALIRDLAAHYGPAFGRRFFDGDDLSGTIIILVNGRDIRHLGNLRAPLRPDDTVAIFPVVAGGAR